MQYRDLNPGASLSNIYKICINYIQYKVPINLFACVRQWIMSRRVACYYIDFWFKYNLDRSTMQSQFHPTGVRIYDPQTCP